MSIELATTEDKLLTTFLRLVEREADNEWEHLELATPRKAARAALHTVLTPLFEDSKRIAAWKPSELDEAAIDRIGRLIDLVNTACPGAAEDTEEPPAPDFAVPATAATLTVLEQEGAAIAAAQDRGEAQLERLETLAACLFRHEH